MLPLFAILHPLVDALSVSVLWIGTQEIAMFFAYNFCAFALQLPMGIVLDLWPRAVKDAFFAGIALLVAGGVLGLCGRPTLPVICACCVGNGLFHLSAGKLILDRTDGRSAPIACFISTGALGLLAGKMLATAHAPLLIPLLAVSLLAGCMAAMRVVPFAVARPHRFRRLPLVNGCLMAGLFILIVGRSSVILTYGSIGGATAFLLIGAFVSLSGQVLGGCLAGVIGRRFVVAANLVGALLLYQGVGMDSPVVALAVLFLAQMATGPVLSLVCDCMGRASGTAFGFNCLGLFVGTF